MCVCVVLHGLSTCKLHANFNEAVFGGSVEIFSFTVKALF